MHAFSQEPWRDSRHLPNVRMLAQWLGGGNHARWEELVQFVEVGYPGQFVPGWDYSRRRGQWELWIRGRTTFCRLMPGLGVFRLRVALTQQEWERARAAAAAAHVALVPVLEAVRPVRRRAVVDLEVVDEETIACAKVLLGAKRPPKATAG